MDVELYLIGRRASLNVQYIKIKWSREEIEKKHPHRRDIIESMKDTEQELLKTIECFKFLESGWRTDSRRCFQLERLNLELAQELAETKKQLNNVTKNLTL